MKKAGIQPALSFLLPSALHSFSRRLSGSQFPVGGRSRSSISFLESSNWTNPSAFFLARDSAMRCAGVFGGCVPRGRPGGFGKQGSSAVFRSSRCFAIFNPYLCNCYIIYYCDSYTNAPDPLKPLP